MRLFCASVCFVPFSEEDVETMRVTPIPDLCSFSLNAPVSADFYEDWQTAIATDLNTHFGELLGFLVTCQQNTPQTANYYRTSRLSFNEDLVFFQVNQDCKWTFSEVCKTLSWLISLRE